MTSGKRERERSSFLIFRFLFQFPFAHSPDMSWISTWVALSRSMRAARNDSSVIVASAAMIFKVVMVVEG